MTNLEIANELCAALINKGLERIESGEPVCLDSYCRATLDMAEILPELLNGRWTPVTEALPELLEGHAYSADVLATVLCTDGSTQIRIMTYGLPFSSNNTGWFDYAGWDYVVTAWMPLPEAYEGDKNEYGD